VYRDIKARLGTREVKASGADIQVGALNSALVILLESLCNYKLHLSREIIL
jgi:hypothetical protein